METAKLVEYMLVPDMTWGEIKGILAENKGQYTECFCGSEYCSHCQGSCDRSITVTFPDESQMIFSNPSQEVFERDITIIE